MKSCAALCAIYKAYSLLSPEPSTHVTHEIPRGPYIGERDALESNQWGALSSLAPQSPTSLFPFHRISTFLSQPGIRWVCVCSRVSGVYPLIIFSVNTQPSADGFRLIHLGQDYTPGQWDPFADVKVLARQVKSNLMHRYLVTPSHIYRVMCGDGIQTLRTFEKVNLRIRSIRIANQNFK